MYRNYGNKNVSPDCLGVRSRYEKDRETSAVEKLCIITHSRSGGTKTEIKSSKLFELTLASLNNINLFYICFEII